MRTETPMQMRCVRQGAALALLLLPARTVPAGAEVPNPAADTLAVSSPPHFRALGADKLQHASLSLSLGAGLGIASRSPSLALGGALALGFAKELRDRRHTRFDFLDLAADLARAT